MHPGPRDGRGLVEIPFNEMQWRLPNLPRKGTLASSTPFHAFVERYGGLVATPAVTRVSAVAKQWDLSQPLLSSAGYGTSWVWDPIRAW